MGVTIHFEGKLLNQSSFEKLMHSAKLFAESNELPYSFFQTEDKVLERIKGEKLLNYQGTTKGVLIQPDPNSDPLNLEFDNELYMQDFCKTQFSDVSVHILIVSFLHDIASYFDSFIVIDEGQYWDTSDIIILQNHFDACFNAIEEAKQNDDSLSGPYRLKDGRIVDLMSNRSH
jgi:hypothetical protein